MNLVSLFSGCGGSCLGFKQAGYNILYANEFVPEAQRTYRANNPGVYLDTRDIRTISPEDIRKVIGHQVIDVLEGSPPCSSFSICGKREKGWGKIRKYSGAIKQRTDDLFLEYIRLLRGLKPRAFVAENVAGLVKGKSKGYFKIILNEMIESGYKVVAGVLDASRCGVPQKRQRLIFIGIRNDLGITPVLPSPLRGKAPTVRDALKDLVTEDVRAWHIPKTSAILKCYLASPGHGFFLGRTHKALFGKPRFFNHVRLRNDRPANTISQTPCVYHPTEPRALTISELKRICGFPDTYILHGSYYQRWERLGRAVPPPLMRRVAESLKNQIG